MTDKEKILAEIERLKNTAEDYIAQGGVDCICARGNVEMADDIIKFINSLPEEPVSEDLEKAAEEYAYTNWASDDYHEGAAEGLPFDAIGHTEKCFKDGAKWQKEQFEKNRLAACDKQTEEEAEIERDFVMGIIEKEHRQPAFDDAIKYGMERMKQQMMAKAIDGDITFDYYSDDDKTYGCIAHDSFCLEDFGLKDRDKVKVIIIKENRV